MQSGRYGLGFTTAAGGAAGETHLLVPMLHYPHGFDVFVSDGEVCEAAALPSHRCRQLVYRHAPGRTEHSLLLRPRPGPRAPRTGAPPPRFGCLCRSALYIAPPARKNVYPKGLDSAAELWLRSALPRSPACRKLNALQAALKPRSSEPSYSAASLPHGGAAAVRVVADEPRPEL